jgi:hypothetical protein
MYELWDAEGRNVVRFFDNAIEAERSISDSVWKRGIAILDPLLLMCEDEHEESAVIAEGQAILVAVKRLSAEESATGRTRRIG